MPTQKPLKRDNDYYLKRLKVDHPGIFADYQAGKFKNTTEALIAAGLRKVRTPLDVLQSAWTNASRAEREAFKKWIGCAPVSNSLVPRSLQSASVAAHGPATSSSGSSRPTKALGASVQEIMDRRSLKMGAVMRELGFNPLDASLGMALRYGTKVRDDLMEALEVWVKANQKR